jgi:hypothetical protein
LEFCGNFLPYPSVYFRPTRKAAVSLFHGVSPTSTRARLRFEITRFIGFTAFKPPHHAFGANTGCIFWYRILRTISKAVICTIDTSFCTSCLWAPHFRCCFFYYQHNQPPLEICPTLSCKVSWLANKYYSTCGLASTFDPAPAPGLTHLLTAFQLVTSSRWGKFDADMGQLCNPVKINDLLSNATSLTGMFLGRSWRWLITSVYQLIQPVYSRGRLRLRLIPASSARLFSCLASFRLMRA